MFRTLSYLAATCISKHEGDVIPGIDLENMHHSPPATRAMRIFDVLYPSRPACELVAKLAVGDRLGQMAVIDLLKHQAQLLALDFHGPGFEVVRVSQPQFLVFTGFGQIDEPGPASDPLCRKITLLIWYVACQAGPLRMYNPDAVEIICEGFPSAEPLAFIAAAIEQLQ
jgi:hypothetical protein